MSTESALIPHFDTEQTVLSQFANSPRLRQLIGYFSQYFDPAASIEGFYSTLWNIDTAIGYGLDIWGEILGVSRVVPIPGTSGAFGFDNADSPPDWENLGNLNVAGAGGPFFAGQIQGSSFALQDGAYRTLLLTKALANVVTTTAPALNALITNLFPGAGRCYTLDAGGMAMRYVFEFALSTIDYAILAYSGVLPHPAGVGTSVIQVKAGLFGFQEAGALAEPFDYGTFYGGN